MEDETPYWESNNKNDNNNINNNDTNKISTYLSKFVGKSCLISFKNAITFPELKRSFDITPISNINATILGYDNHFLFIEYTGKKKKFNSLIDINCICAISKEAEE